MKIALLSFFFLMASVSWGRTSVCDQTWEQIDQNPHIAVDSPKVQFGSVFVSITDVCVQGEYLKTRNAVSVCAHPSFSDRSACLHEEMKVLSTPITEQKQIPVGDHDWQTVTQTHSLKHSLPVGRWTEAGILPVCYKSFDIPLCQE